jgi:predicted outer membrane repeat protein
VTGAVFTGNADGAINDGGPMNGLVGDVAIAGSTFIRNDGGISYENYGGPQPGPPNSGFAVTRSAFTGNTGGAINCPIYSFWCDFTISHSSFTANSGSAIDAGGFTSEPLSANPGGVVISVTDTTFTRNSSTQGGAINLDSGDGDVTAIRDTFAGNTATQGGGGIYADFPGDTTVKDSLFTGNSAPAGGAINNSGTTQITGSAFRGNTASADGGALYNDTSATITGTTFTRNTAHSDGGAIYQSYNQTFPSTHLPDLSLTRSRIRGNYAGQHGGGLDDAVLPALPDLTAAAALTSSQVIANLAGQDGGGIYNQGGAVPLTSTLIMNNHPDNCAPTGSVPGCTD